MHPLRHGCVLDDLEERVAVHHLPGRAGQIASYLERGRVHHAHVGPGRDRSRIAGHRQDAQPAGRQAFVQGLRIRPEEVRRRQGIEHLPGPKTGLAAGLVRHLRGVLDGVLEPPGNGQVVLLDGIEIGAFGPHGSLESLILGHGRDGVLDVLAMEPLPGLDLEQRDLRPEFGGLLRQPIGPAQPGALHREARGYDTERVQAGERLARPGVPWHHAVAGIVLSQVLGHRGIPRRRVVLKGVCIAI